MNVMAQRRNGLDGPLRIVRGTVVTAGCLGAGVLLSYPLWRAWCLNWGATQEEVGRTLPGDDLLAEPDIVSTRAISIGAPPEAVWPWLAQMGPGRGGVYTYDWIENLLGLHVHSTDEVLPEYQGIEVGFAQRLGKAGPVLRVAVLTPGSTMVLRSDDGNWIWAFSVDRTAGGSRLISRNRISTPGASLLARTLTTYVMEPGSLVMERKMLLGIRQRAQRLAMQNPSAVNCVPIHE